MKYELSELQREVRIAMDENMVSSPLAALGDIDTLSLDEIIKSKICDAARAVEQEAPTYLLDSGKAFGDSIKWKGQVGIGMGSIHLPDDFMRLVTFQMSDWSRAVTTAISEDDPQYELQSSRYPGIRGNPQKPIVAISMQPIGLVLEFYSCTGGENVFIRRARYIPIPRIEDDEIDICEKLKTAIVYHAAYLTALSIKYTDLATSMLNTSKDYMK